MELKKLTEELLTITLNADNIYMKKRVDGVKGDFFSEVKPFADYARDLTERWEREALQWLKATPRNRHLHPLKVKATSENLELVCVQAFFPETSFKRFKSYIQSITYVLREMLAVLAEESAQDSL